MVCFVENDRERYNLIISEAAKLLTPAEVKVLKLGLSLHIYSPKVEMFGQIAAERKLPACPIVADVGGTLTCSTQEMKKLIKPVSFYLNFFIFIGGIKQYYLF